MGLKLKYISLVPNLDVINTPKPTQGANARLGTKAMGEERDTGWGACFVSNRFRRGNGSCAQLCKNTWDSTRGLEN